MRGLSELWVQCDYDMALELYNKSLEVLRWGNDFWKGISYEEKGMMFKTTFIRGVKCLRLEALIRVCSSA